MVDAHDRFAIALEGQRLLGHYLVGRKLAEGGMGAVYLAEDTDLVGKSVVVKVPHTQFLAEPGFRERFRFEMHGLMALEHPHVVRILAQGEHDGVPFFVLQHLRGNSLSSKLKGAPGKRLPAREVASWLPDVARALDFVHGKGVVHRDVKPGNILFDEHGHVFLSDFGIAKALSSEETSYTPTGFAPGSPAYMAPEQAMGAKPSGAADQYALATVVYEVVGGRPTHSGETPLAVLMRKQSENPPSLADVAPEVPAAASAAVMRALSRDPAARFPTCTAFAEAFVAGLSAPAPAPVPDLTAKAPSRPPAVATPSGSKRAAGSKTPSSAEGIAPAKGSGKVGVVLACVLTVVGLAGTAFFVFRTARPKGTGGIVVAPGSDGLQITIESPKEGENLAVTHSRFKATLAGLREGDSVLLDGKAVPPQGPWSANMQVEGALDVGPSGPDVVILEVVDAKGARRGAATVSVVYRVEMDEGARAFLADWAAPVGTVTDGETRFPSRIRRTKDGGEMVLIPGGRFPMGAVPGDLGARDDESPRHVVTLSKAYYMDVAEVTRRQFRAFAFAAKSVALPEMTLDGTTDETPAYNVTYEEARMFSAWAGVHLPTEAEWERAARGGHDDHVYPWGATDDVKLRNGGGEDDDGFKGLAPVRSYKPNDYGLFDMAGNVWEWCADWYDEKYYATSPLVDPAGPVTGSNRVIRGSAWNSASETGPYDFQASRRGISEPNARVFSYGFRCAKRLP